MSATQTMTDKPRENTAKGVHDTIAQWLFNRDDLKKVLDIPSGEGAFTARCLEHGLEVHSADCQNLLKVDNPRFSQADMNRELPFEDDELDAVVCIDGIEHIERPFDFLREAQRVTRRGGAVVVSTPNISSLRSRWRFWLTGFHNKCKSPLDETNPNPLHHINMLSFHKLRYMLHTTGWQITDITTNRKKPLAFLHGAILPLAWLTTKRVMNKEEKDPGQRERNKEIVAQMHTPEILFGETMIVMARNEQPR